jgi:hypothetical protein
MVPAEKCLTSQRMGPWAGMSHHHTKRNVVTIPPGADLVELNVPLPIRTTNRKAEMASAIFDRRRSGNPIEGID